MSFLHYGSHDQNKYLTTHGALHRDIAVDAKIFFVNQCKVMIVDSN
jgi:hypothetical protein